MRKYAISIGCLALFLTVPVVAANLAEINGPWYVASPTFYSTPNSGTYYFPSVVALGSNAFLFAQGGQFFANTVPATVSGTFSSANFCEGDKITLWRGPLTAVGLQSPFTQIRLVSRCDSNSTTRYHWGPAGAFLAGTTGPVYILAERQGIDKASGTQTSASQWWYRGVANSTTNPTDISSWAAVKLFDIAPNVGRIGCCTMAFDSTRGAPPAGHIYTRGYGGLGQSSFEARFEFSTADQSFARVEIKSGGVWRLVLNNLLDFTPDTQTPNFRVKNILNRAGTLELWGSTVYPTQSVNCPCIAANSAQQSWYTIAGNVSGGNWTLVGPNHVVEASPRVRCNPAGPAALRNGAEIVSVAGNAYMFSEQNWEGIDPVDPNQPCPAQPFQGMDIVTTRVQ